MTATPVNDTTAGADDIVAEVSITSHIYEAAVLQGCYLENKHLQH
jgi:hypothetical protein